MKFEDALQKLQDIVDTLEAGDLSLDTAIEKYQQGIELSKQCLSLLKKAEKKIQICVKDSKGTVKLKTLSQSDNAGEDN